MVLQLRDGNTDGLFCFIQQQAAAVNCVNDFPVYSLRCYQSFLVPVAFLVG